MFHAEMIAWAFALGLVVSVLGEVYLAERQRRHLLRSRDRVPEGFTNYLSLEEHRKAVDYSRVKLGFGQLSGVINGLAVLVMVFAGGFQWLFALAAMPFGDDGAPTLAGQWLFLLSLLLVGSLFDLPFRLYQTFVIEERFGFNRMTVGNFLLDQVKELAVALVLLSPLLWVLLALMGWFADGSWWLPAWLVWIGFQFLMLLLFPTVIAPLFNKFTPLEEGELKERVMGLIERCGFHSNGVFVMDASSRSSHGNAYFTGFGANKRIVLFDTLLANLTPDEAEAVLAHELGHYKHGHVRIRLVQGVVLFFVAFAVAGWLSIQAAFYQGMGFTGPSDAAALVIFALWLGVVGFPFAPMLNGLSRKHEFEADSFAAGQVAAGRLVEALVKLHKESAVSVTNDRWYSLWHHSHPPIEERIVPLLR